MFKISYSPNLKWEINVPWSKNAALPIVAANYCVDNQVKLNNQPNIVDLHNLKQVADNALKISKDYFDLTDELVKSIRVSILLIPLGLLKYGKVKFIWAWWCKLGKRPLTTFDDALMKAWVKITEWSFKEFEVIWKPKQNIMLQEFSVTATEALITYLAFANNFYYDINIYQVATEPHVKNLIDFLNNCGANIVLNVDHTITVKPSKINIKNWDFNIINDYIQAGTYFAIWAWADNSEITIRNFDVDNLSSMYNIANKIWINFKILDKHTVRVNSYNKQNYKATKFETRIFPGFPTDLQSIFGTLLTQSHGISKIFETLFEWRFTYLAELENLWAKIEILNPHQVLIIWPTKLTWWHVSSTDLRWWWAMVLAWIMANGNTYVMKEDIILRWYEDIVWNLRWIWVNIERISD